MPHERLPHHRILDDHHFQDWMVSVDLLKRKELPEGEKRPHFDSGQLKSELMSSVVQILDKDWGYIVPGDRMPGNSSYRAVKLAQFSRDYPDFPSVFHAQHLGLAFGVEHLNLSPQALMMLYVGSKNFARLIPFTRHSDFLYGSHDQSDLRATNHVMQRLQKRDLVGTTLTMDHITLEGGDYLRLADSEILKGKRNSKRFSVDPTKPPHLQHPYQDWLVNEAGLAERTIDPKWKVDPNKIVTAPESLSAGSRAVLAMLSEQTGYIVDKPSLAIAAFGDKPPENWYQRLFEIARELNSQLIPDVEISKFHNIGWSLGLEKLNLPLLPLQALYHLWQECNVPYGYPELARDLYGRATGKNAKRTQNVVTKLSGHLKGSNYAVGSAILFDQPKRTHAPILVKRELIIDK